MTNTKIVNPLVLQATLRDLSNRKNADSQRYRGEKAAMAAGYQQALRDVAGRFDLKLRDEVPA